jgi:hypothetical protein
MNQTAEWIFDGEVYALKPLIVCENGFKLANIKESGLKKRYCFESFGL